MATVIFWAALALLIYTYVLYPALLWAVDRGAEVLRRQQGASRERENLRPGWEQNYPAVSMVVAAYNEEDCIEAKIQNSLSLNYPKERFQLLIGSDGSTDNTDARVKACSDPRVSLSSAPRGGKAEVLNRCIPDAEGPIVVLSDANTRVDAAAIEKLVARFADPDVGAVCGRLKLFHPEKGECEETAYWSYESWIKFLEGKRGSVIGANGGLYAIRRSLFRRLPEGTVVDDFVIPLRILEQGYRVEYEPEAIAFEETATTTEAEFGRRTRIAAGNFQSLTLLSGLLSPAQGFNAFAFWSHKVLRWSVPFLMILALLSNAWLLEARFYQAMFMAQLAFYGLALTGEASLWGGKLKKLASIARYFVTMNLAILVGFWKFLRGTQSAAWNRTPRSATLSFR